MVADTALKLYIHAGCWTVSVSGSRQSAGCFCRSIHVRTGSGANPRSYSVGTENIFRCYSGRGWSCTPSVTVWNEWSCRPAPTNLDDFMVFIGTDLPFFNITFGEFLIGVAVVLNVIPRHLGMRQDFVVPLWTKCAFNSVVLFQFGIKFLLHSPWLLFTNHATSRHGVTLTYWQSLQVTEFQLTDFFIAQCNINKARMKRKEEGKEISFYVT